MHSSSLTSPRLVKSQSSSSEHITIQHREQCRTTRHVTCYIAPVPLSDHVPVHEQALTFARSIQATYFESSAPLGRGVNEIFTAAANIQYASELLTMPHSPPPSASKSFFERMRRKTTPSSSPPALASPHGTWARRRAFKCVVLGGKSSGKANMVHRYLHGVFEVRVHLTSGRTNSYLLTFFSLPFPFRYL